MEEILKVVSTAEFWKFVGAIVGLLTAIVILFMKNRSLIEEKLKYVIKNDIDGKLTDISERVGNVEDELVNLNDAIAENTKITAEVKSKKEACELLEKAVNNSLEYILDVKLREFIVVKTKSVIQFALDLFDTDLSQVTDLQIITKIDSEKNLIAKRGEEILGAEFIERFYGSVHGEATEWYKRDILNILHCNINYKTESIRVKTEGFLNDTIRALMAEYNAFKKEKGI